jgi:hypothetical protein
LACEDVASGDRWLSETTTRRMGGTGEPYRPTLVAHDAQMLCGSRRAVFSQRNQKGTSRTPMPTT